MHRMRRGCPIAGFLVWLVIASCSCEGQFSANFQTNIISATTNTISPYIVGSNTFADVLLIRNKGQLTSMVGYAGYEAASSNNTAVVTDPGSVLNGLYDNLTIGYHG